MQIILNLIRLRADKAVAHAIHGFVKFISRINAKVTKARAHFSEEKLRKAAAASQLVFIDPRLAFMDPHGRALPYGREPIVRINILFITAMSDLMDRGIKTVERIMRIRTRGDTHILP